MGSMRDKIKNANLACKKVWDEKADEFGIQQQPTGSVREVGDIINCKFILSITEVKEKKIRGRLDVEKYVDYMCSKCGGDSICDVRDCKNREEYRKQAKQMQEADCIILEEVVE